MESVPPSRAGLTDPGKKRGGIVIPQQPNWHGRAGAWLIYLILSGTARTWQIRTVEPFAESVTEPVIFAIWHNRLAIVMAFWDRVQRQQPSLNLGALVSASRDGGLLAKSLEHFGVQPVRGSSSRRGPQALREAASLVKAGYCVAITPDGPRGPKYKVQPGIVALAQLTGRPILPAGAAIGSRKDLRSWDHFQIPLPFSKCEFGLGNPIHVPREASEEMREAKRLELEAELRRLNPD